MKKLRLELDQLSVDSFDAGEEPASARGTVKAKQDEPSVDVECAWTTNPLKDCWAPTFWPWPGCPDY